jgi:hypothetical protein
VQITGVEQLALVVQQWKEEFATAHETDDTAGPQQKMVRKNGLHSGESITIWVNRPSFGLNRPHFWLNRPQFGPQQNVVRKD